MWHWEGEHLVRRGTGEPCAELRGNELYFPEPVAAQLGASSWTLQIKRSPRFSLDAAGMRCWQGGISTKTLLFSCQGRNYRAQQSGWTKQRTITPSVEQAPLADQIFMAVAIHLVDDRYELRLA